MSNETPAKKQIISLGGPHTHKGVDYDKGDLIEVTARQADNLKKINGARDAAPAEIKKWQDAQQ